MVVVGAEEDKLVNLVAVVVVVGAEEDKLVN